MILLIDNYDSFAHNLARYLTRLGQSVHVARNDILQATDVRRLAPRAIVLSPGPCTPREAGCSLDLVRTFHQRIPMLGVCLGHQTIVAALGGQIVPAPQPVHGRASQIIHDANGVFANVPNPLTVGRYHSLVVDPNRLPPTLEISARTDDDVVMAVRHHHLPIAGLQFHPESVLTECGYLLLANFLRLAGLEVVSPLPSLGEELLRVPAAGPMLPRGPVTF